MFSEYMLEPAALFLLKDIISFWIWWFLHSDNKIPHLLVFHQSLFYMNGLIAAKHCDVCIKRNLMVKEEYLWQFSITSLPTHSYSPTPTIPFSTDFYKMLGQPATNMILPNSIRLLGIFQPKNKDPENRLDWTYQCPICTDPTTFLIKKNESTSKLDWFTNFGRNIMTSGPSRGTSSQRMYR